MVFFFFKQKTAYEMRISDWSSDVCSSDLIALDDSAVIRRSPEVEHERAVAIYDLLEDNFFRPLGDYSGPYHLRLSIAETRLQLDIRDEDGQRLDSVALPLLPFRRVIRDRSEEHTSELQSLMRISYAVFCLKKKN